MEETVDMLFKELLLKIFRVYGPEGAFMVKDITPWYSSYSHAQGDVYRLWRMRYLARFKPEKGYGHGNGYCYILSKNGINYVKWLTKPETMSEFTNRLLRERLEYESMRL
jgi:hypothetical protein